MIEALLNLLAAGLLALIAVLAAYVVGSVEGERFDYRTDGEILADGFVFILRFVLGFACLLGLAFGLGWAIARIVELFV